LKLFKYTGVALLTLILCGILYIGVTQTTGAYGTIEADGAPSLPSEIWDAMIASDVNEGGVTITMNGAAVTGAPYPAYMGADRTLYIPVHSIGSIFDRAAIFMDNDHLVIQDSAESITCDLAEGVITNNDTTLSENAAAIQIDSRYYLPVTAVASSLGYNASWDRESDTLSLTTDGAEKFALPSSYDYRDTDRKSKTKDQGNQGTCWAIATSTALETSLLPSDPLIFAPDHISIRNSFHMSQDDGGNYTMSMAYLTAWQGPVLESQDPYGDGVSPEGLTAVRHVQEIQIVSPGDIEGIKEAVYKYGGVESAFYLDMQNAYSSSAYYNRKTYGYCYTGSEEANHDAVIIGWDDDYPASSFPVSVAGNGAFICQNSWGSAFGDNGVFYVSYYDAVLGKDNIVYSDIESNDNYDTIYQSDLCGWIGQLGYSDDKAMFANAYTASSNELIKAVGFYATGPDTSYSVYFVPDFSDTVSLRAENPVAEGTLNNAGYYTIPFYQPEEISSGQKFAVIVQIKTPDVSQPIAIEFQADEVSSAVVVGDGEGYISYSGAAWASAESEENCDICLKVYADENGG